MPCIVRKAFFSPEPGAPCYKKHMVTLSSAAANRILRKNTPALALALGGCLLGALVTGGGVWLADQQKSVLAHQSAAWQEERAQLQCALRQAHLTGPRLRLAELAAMPLVPEYLHFATENPGGRDARELGDYLRRVLEAVLEESGLTRLTLETAAGTALIDVSAGAAMSPPDAGQLGLQAPVLSLTNRSEQIGQLTASLAAKDTALLLPAGDKQEASRDASPSARDQARLFTVFLAFALLAGVATAATGVCGAALFWRGR